jgi:predicted pyridoxine 5'-phosphate oxidase superfamily flavin-nucleotide-binding protein
MPRTYNTKAPAVEDRIQKARYFYLIRGLSGDIGLGQVDGYLGNRPVGRRRRRMHNRDGGGNQIVLLKVRSMRIEGRSR